MERPKLLVVDDDRDLLKLMSAELQRAGFRVVTASDGVSAVMVAQRSKPDAVLLDIGLPGGDGYMVIRRLRALAPFAALPIVVVTGKTLTAEEEKTIRAQAHDLLHKPIDFDRLLAAIRAALAGPGRSTPSGASHSPSL